MKRLKIITIIMLVHLSLSNCATPISGRVTTANGDPIHEPDARVNVALLSGDPMHIGKTSAVVPLAKDGSFQVRDDLVEGQYMVEALIPGYKSSSATIDIRESNKVDLIATPIEGPKATAVGVNTDLELDRGLGGATLTPPKM